MKSWDELTNRLMIGTARQPFTQLAGELPSGAERITPEAIPDGNDRLLALAGVLGQVRRCGVVPARWEDELPQPAAEETVPQADAKVVARYEQIKASKQTLLREWLDYAAESGLRLPPSLVADVLEIGRSNRDFRRTAAKLVGECGRWLCAHEERFKHVLADDKPRAVGGNVWEDGSFDDRVALLSEERQRDPDAARERLAAGFKTFPVREREAFLQCLQTNLSGADESFLETCLDDKAKAVRQAARVMLAQLPTSAFVGRMRARVAKYFTLQKSGMLSNLVGNKSMQLDVEMPTDVTPEDQRDFECETKVDLAELQNRLREIISLCPPTLWMDVFSLSEAEFVYLVQNGKVKDKDFKNNYWLRGIWAAVANLGGASISLLYQFANDAGMVNQMGAPMRMKLLETAAEKRDSKVAMLVLSSYFGLEGRMTPELSAALIRTLVPLFGASTVHDADAYKHRFAFTTLSNCLHASCYPLALECLPSGGMEGLHQDFTEFFNQYQARYEIYKELLL